ncbi:hypothetical protein LTR62_004498 [Meristemomyces frigidus]|uniref:Stc1 domain-containing protein n=1 Tax=Meristemomyces frigidus TaxID=1508187 RepID=A0AAN7TQT6_9PEZI|nr:hypothetical protein LTR62_004498 [Meristemomyces frigidus]
MTSRTRCMGNKCHGKLKPMKYFSPNQQLELKKLIAKPSKTPFNPEKDQHIICLTCTPGEKFEFFCQGCDKVHPRDAFSKVQRRKPDNAYCWEAMKRRQEMEPMGDRDDVTDSDSSGGGNDSDDDGSDYGGSTLPGAMDGVSLGGSSVNHSSTTGGVAVPGSDTRGSRGGWTSYREPYTTGAKGTSTSTPSISASGSVSAGQSTPKRVLPASAAFHSGNIRSNYASSYADSSTTEQASGGGKFAKIKAYKPEPEREPAEEENEDSVRAASDSEDDSD